MVCIFRSLQSLSILCWFGTQPWSAILVFLIDGASLLYYTLWTIWIKQDKVMINFQRITLGNTLFLTEVLSISFGMCSQWHWIKIILVMAHLMTLSYIWGELFESERSSDDKLAQIFCFSWQEEKKLPYPTFHCQPWQSKFDGYQTTAEEVQGKLQFVFSISSFLKFERLVTFLWVLCLIMIGFG